MSFLSQPDGYYRLFSAFALERFMFYGVRSLLVLLLIRILAFSQSEAASIYAVFTGATWLFTIVGGILADTILRQRGPLRWSCLLGFLGTLFISIACFTGAKPSVYIGLGFFAVGTGVFRPAVYARLIELFSDKNDTRIDSGFVFFGVAANLGGFLAPLICGALGDKVNMGLGVLVAGFAMIAALGIIRSIPNANSETDFSRGVDRLVYQPILLLYAIVLVPLLIATQYTSDLVASFQSSNLIVMVSKGVLELLAAVFIPLIWLNRARVGKSLTTVPKLGWGIGLTFVGVIICVFSQVYQLPVSSALISIPTFLFLAVGSIYIEPVFRAYVCKLAPAKWRTAWIGGWMAVGTGIAKLVSVGATKVEWQGGVTAIPIAAVILSIVLLVLLREKIQRWAAPVL